MRERMSTLIAVFAALALMTGCSTGGTAQKDEEPRQAEGAMTQEEGEDAEDDEEMEGEEDEDDEDEDDMSDEDMEKKEEMKEKMAEMCPMRVEGTSAEAMKKDGAVHVDFTTDGDVEEVRERARKMAAHHNKMKDKYKKHKNKRAKNKGNMGKGKKKGKMKGKKKHKSGKMRPMGMTLEVEDIDNGARMVHTPDDAEDLDKLNARMQKHVARMNEHNKCWTKMGKRKGDDMKKKGDNMKKKGKEMKEKKGKSNGGDGDDM